MATILSQPTALCFSSDIPDYTILCNGEKGDLAIDLVSDGTRFNILGETVYADSNHVVSVTDVSSLVEPYVKKYLQMTLEVSFTDTGGTATGDPVTVLFSRADVGTTAAAFTAGHFLTTLNGEKITALGREERLYAYGAATATVIAEVQLPNGTYDTLSASLSASGTTGDVSQFDVSPSNMISLIGLTGGRLISYIIQAEGRRQVFRCVTDYVLPAPSLLFTNSFGCQEFIHCVGKHKKDSKYERKSTRINGYLRNYLVTEDRKFTGNTGWLNEAMADWADDLFRSEEVYLWVNGVKGREVVITDSKSEIDNEDDDMPAFEFTYSYAQRIHNVMQPEHAGRIFDNTFDTTFN